MAGSEASVIDAAVLADFLRKLAGGGADASFLADVIDLAHPSYQAFCTRELPLLLDALANERAAEEMVVGPSLTGSPRWDRTILGRRTGRLLPTQFVSRMPVRNFALPENRLVLWLVGSMIRGVTAVRDRVGENGLPPSLAAVFTGCTAALSNDWFRQVPMPVALDGEMMRAAARQRIPGYRSAAKLAERRAKYESRDPAARWLRIIDLLRANWLEPVDEDDLFELYALALVLDVMERDLGHGEPSEYGLVIGSRRHVAAFDAGGVRTKVFFDQSPGVAFGAASRYRVILDTHVGVGRRRSRRPDIVIRTTGPAGSKVFMVEVKKTKDDDYISDSIYKAFGYLHDYSGLWSPGIHTPRLLLLFPEDIRPVGVASITASEVVMSNPEDRPSIAEALRLGQNVAILPPVHVGAV